MVVVQTPKNTCHLHPVAPWLLYNVRSMPGRGMSAPESVLFIRHLFSIAVITSDHRLGGWIIRGYRPTSLEVRSLTWTSSQGVCWAACAFWGLYGRVHPLRGCLCPSAPVPFCNNTRSTSTPNITHPSLTPTPASSHRDGTLMTALGPPRSSRVTSLTRGPCLSRIHGLFCHTG